MLPPVARRAAIALLLPFIGLFAPAGAFATDELPITGEVITLPGSTRGAIVGDLDGDGVREVIRLVRGEAGALAVEAWRDDGDAWRSLGAVDLRRGATIDELAKGFGDADDMVPLLVNELAALLAWDRDGRERILVATIGFSGQFMCCLALFELELGTDEELRLRHLPGAGQSSFGAAAQIHALDIDADGTDELVLSEEAGSSRQIRVLSWEGGRLSVAEPSATQGWPGELPDSAWPLGVFDLDGDPGQEFVYARTDDRSVGPPGSMLYRVTERSVGFTVEIAEIEGVANACVGKACDDLLVTDPVGMRPLEWRARRVPQLGPQTSAAVVGLLGSIGTGEQALHLAWQPIVAPGEVELIVMGPSFEELGRVGASADARRIADRAAQISMGAARLWPWPYVGPLPGGDRRGRPAYLFLGQLIAPSEEGFTVTETSPLFGLTAVGLAGKDRGWLVTVGGEMVVPFGDRHAAYLEGPTSSELRLLPASAWLGRVRSGTGELEAALDGAAFVGARPAATDPDLLYAGEEAFTVSVPVPEGSRLLPIVDGIGGARPLETAIDAIGRQAVEIEPSTGGFETGFDLTLILTSANGDAAVREWQVRMLTELPVVEATGETVPLEFAATITGIASQPGSVLADGNPVAVGDDGAFVTDVTALPWPRSVRVEVVDPLGRRATAVVEVLGLVDYRGWPWAGIVAALTVGAGAILYLRAGSLTRAPSAERSPATLEEIER